MRAVSALAAERAAAASTAQEAVATPKAKTVQTAGLEGTDVVVVVVVVVDLPKKSLAHSCIRSSRNHHCTSIRLGDETDRS